MGSPQSKLKHSTKRVLADLAHTFWPSCRPWRPQWLPRFTPIQAEVQVHYHCEAEKPELFLAANAGSTELEVLNWLYATVIMTKPRTILETGCLDGFGTVALAAACKANGFGIVHSVDIDPEACEKARAKLRRRGLSKFAEVHCVSSLDFLRSTTLRFEMGFFDSLCELRPEEYEICVERGILDGVAAFHDTSPHRTETMKEWPEPAVHDEYRRRLRALASRDDVTGFFELTLSRGLFVIFRAPSKNLPSSPPAAPR